MTYLFAKWSTQSYSWTTTVIHISEVSPHKLAKIRSVIEASSSQHGFENNHGHTINQNIFFLLSVSAPKPLFPGKYLELSNSFFWSRWLSIDLSSRPSSRWDQRNQKCVPCRTIYSRRVHLLHRGALRRVCLLDGPVHLRRSAKQWGWNSIQTSWATHGERSRVLLLPEILDLQLLSPPEDHVIPQGEGARSWESLRRLEEALGARRQPRVRGSTEEAQACPTSCDYHGCSKEAPIRSRLGWHTRHRPR